MGLSGFVQIFSGDVDKVSTTKEHDLGTLAADNLGNVYIYVQGVTGLDQYEAATYDELFATAVLTANAVGPVGVAQATLDATTKYGWLMVKGKTTAKVDTVADNKALFIDATDGRFDDAVVTGDLVVGAWTRSTDSNNLATVQLDWPKVTDVLG